MDRLNIVHDTCDPRVLRRNVRPAVQKRAAALYRIKAETRLLAVPRDMLSFDYLMGAKPDYQQ